MVGINGSGKSTIWGLLQAVFYGSTPTGHKRDELVKHNGDAFFSVEFDRDSDDYKVTFSRVKKKWAYSVQRNGADHTAHSQIDATKDVVTILGLSKAEFEGSVHLTQNSQHILMDGSPKSRRDYLARFFGIDERYDIVFNRAKAKLVEVQGTLSALSGLSYTATALRESLAATPWRDPNPTLSSIALIDTHIKQCSATFQEILLAKKWGPTALKYKDPENLAEQLKQDLSHVGTMLSQNAANKRHNAIARRNAELKNSITSRLAQVVPTDLFNTDLEKEKQALLQHRTHDQFLAPLRAEYETLPKGDVPDLTRVGEAHHKARNDLLIEQHRYENIKSGTCPVCKAEYRQGDLSSMLEKIRGLEEDYATIDEDFAFLQDKRTKLLRSKQIEQQINGTTPWTKEHEQRLQLVNETIPAKREWQDLTGKLEVIGEVHLLPEADDTALLCSRDEKQGLLTQVEECVRARSYLPGNFEGLMVFNAEETQLKLQALEEEKAAAQQALGKIQTDNDNHLRLKQRIEEIESKLSGLPELKAWEVFWTKMADAYGPRGLRIQKMAEIADCIVQRLPYYANMLFDEPGLTFSYEVSATDVLIVAKRREIDEETGKETWFEHDISSFSGGEKRRMSVALVLTLADCVPTSKRTNMLVLDEIDANLDDIGQHRFAHELLPALKSEYESIFVITHSETMQRAATYDQVLRVVKRNHWSHIQTD
jgi:DNA repair exonuclease SbcCD ATPase subunit